MSDFTYACLCEIKPQGPVTQFHSENHCFCLAAACVTLTIAFRFLSRHAWPCPFLASVSSFCSFTVYQGDLGLCRGEVGVTFRWGRLFLAFVPKCHLSRGVVPCQWRTSFSQIFVSYLLWFTIMLQTGSIYGVQISKIALHTFHSRGFFRCFPPIFAHVPSRYISSSSSKNMWLSKLASLNWPVVYGLASESTGNASCSCAAWPESTVMNYSSNKGLSAI